jgi:hypothetical protein
VENIRAGEPITKRPSPCGSLGFFVRSKIGSIPFAVVSSHVVGRDLINRPQAVSLKQVALNGTGDEIRECRAGVNIGTRIWCARLETTSVTEVDFALVRLNDNPNPEMPQISQPSDYLRSATISGQPIVALVQRGGLRRGKFEKVLPEDRRLPFEGLADPIPYRRLHQVKYDEETAPGMSGSVVVGLEGSLRGVILGIHVGGNGKTGFFQRVDPLWERFELYRT